MLLTLTSYYKGLIQEIAVRADPQIAELAKRFHKYDEFRSYGLTPILKELSDGH